jgi:hypothetical protein
MKNFQNNWFCYSYPYYSGSSIYMSTPLPEGQQGAKAEALTDKIKQPSIKDSLGFYSFRFSFRGNHHYLWDKKRNLVQVEGRQESTFIIRKRLKVLLMKM